MRIVKPKIDRPTRETFCKLIPSMLFDYGLPSIRQYFIELSRRATRKSNPARKFHLAAAEGQNLSILRSCIVLACLGLSLQTEAAGSDTLSQFLKPAPASDTLKSSPIFEGRGDGVTTCPVTGEKIRSKKYHLSYSGREVYFCCKGCFQRGKHKPERFLKPGLDEQNLAVKAFLATSPKPINGGEVCDE